MIQVLPILSFDSSNFFLLGSLIWGGRRRYSNVFIGTNLFLIWLKDELRQLPNTDCHMIANSSIII